ncbi:MAG: FAD:protein FMN transferase [Beduini sp.]|uniref:FAD:protein FMN transferase n=1 Tax=Beduini sp. TaxID=1922300 RepID=UPI0039A29BAF
MKPIKIILAVILSLALAGCQSSSSKYQYLKDSFTGPFDTVIEYMAYVKSQKEFDTQMKLIKEELTRLDQLFDKYTSYEGLNNIKTINDNAGIKAVSVDPVIVDMLQKSVTDYKTVSSKVNIAMGSVLSLWHDSRDNAVDGVGVPPSTSQLEEASQHMNIDSVEIDTINNTVYISDPKTSIDVGATAKGYAIEYVKQVLIDNGVEAFLISGGGNIASYGERKIKANGNESVPRSKNEFFVGIESPNNGAYSDGKYPAMIIADNKAIVTSGDYQRNFKDKDGNVYSHLVDPDTLYPATYFRSVSVITEDSGYADFLSSTLFLLPYEEGKALVDSLEGVEAVWLLNDGTVQYTDGLVEGDNFHLNR